MLPVHSLTEAHNVLGRKALHLYPFLEWEESNLGRKQHRIPKTVVRVRGWNSQPQSCCRCLLSTAGPQPPGTGSCRGCSESGDLPWISRGWFRLQLLRNWTSYWALGYGGSAVGSKYGLRHF